MRPILPKRNARAALPACDPFGEVVPPPRSVAFIAEGPPPPPVQTPSDCTNDPPRGAVSGFFAATTTADDTDTGVRKSRKLRKRPKVPPDIVISVTPKGEVVVWFLDRLANIYRMVPGAIERRLLWRLILANGLSVRESSLDPPIHDIAKAVCHLKDTLEMFDTDPLVVREQGDAKLKRGVKAKDMEAAVKTVMLRVDVLVISRIPLEVLNDDHAQEVFAETYGTRSLSDTRTKKVTARLAGTRACRKP